jgi:ferric-dicitrate binding protein FerR (iron transport regulator)
VTSPPLDRLDDLFVRFWDDGLTAAEEDELARLLGGDPAARRRFQLFCTQAVACADLPATPLPAADEVPVDLGAHGRPTARPRLWSRRGVLGLVGGGLAAGIGAVALGRSFWGPRAGEPDQSVRVAGVQGTALVRTTDGQLRSAAGLVPPGATVATQGVGSTATLVYPDGSTVSLLNDSALSVRDGGRALVLHHGTAGAELRPRAGAERLTLSTPLLALPGADDTSITLGQGARSTEVEVHHGSVSVSAPTGEPLAVVREGELLTVGADGARTQQPTPAPPEAFRWDLSTPLPPGWVAGRREVADGEAVVSCAAWPDPYYGGAVMRQIRSDDHWGRGLFRLAEGSVVHVRYRARRAAPAGQMCFCVRTPEVRCPDTGMLEYNGGFEPAAAGAWRWLRVPAVAMTANRHAPAFGPPWVSFLIIFNTFETDVGLEVAEFRVTPPGG